MNAKPTNSIMKLINAGNSMLPSQGNEHFVRPAAQLRLLAISAERDPEGLLIQQLQYVYQCVVSLVTDTRLAALKRDPRMNIFL